MPTEIKLKYSAEQTLTPTGVAGLASDTNLLTGIEVAEIDNRTQQAEDIIVNILTTTGTSPTDARRIEIWAIAADASGNYPDVFDGTTSSETISSATMKANICQLVVSFATTSTSDQKYRRNGISLRQVFGGVLPGRCVLFQTHNTGVALNSTAANHAMTYQFVTAEIQ